MNFRLYAVTVVLLGLVFLPGCKKDEAALEVIRPVRSIVVGDFTGFTQRTLPGRAKATQEVNLSFRVTGPMVEFPADQVGKIVKKGDLLAKIDPRDFEVALRNAQGDLARAKAHLDAMRKARPEDIEKLKAEGQIAQARYARAEADYQRAVPLVKSGAITRSEFDLRIQTIQTTKAQLTQAQENYRIGQTGARPEDIAAQEAEIHSLEAAVDAAQDQRDYTELRAPFGGKVAATFVENFQTVQAKQSILRLVDNSRVEMVVNVPEGAISLIQYVTDVKCSFDAFPDLEIPATISEIGTEASRTTRTYPVTVIMDQPEGVEILPGMAGKAWGKGQLPDDLEAEGFEIPESAIFARDDAKFVWVVREDQTVSAKGVEVGELMSRGIRVKGVSLGERIATAGVHYLKEGQKVRVENGGGGEEPK